MSSYAYLGPSGTFTEQALRQITNKDDKLTPYANVTAALNAVRSGVADKAFVPIENSVEGVVARTLDELAVGQPLVVTAETTLPVSFALMILPEHEGKTISKIATHPHAEIVAMRAAAEKLNNWRLDGCTVVVTLEPCAMCAGAIAQSRVAKLIFGAWDEKAGAVGSVWDILRDPRSPHRTQVSAGVMEEECAQLLSDFFKEQRLS